MQELIWDKKLLVSHQPKRIYERGYLLKERIKTISNVEIIDNLLFRLEKKRVPFDLNFKGNDLRVTTLNAEFLIKLEV